MLCAHGQALKMNIPDSEILRAAEILKRGGIVAFPTETVYGIGASVFHKEAIQRIFQVKGRPQDNPLIVHIASLEQLALIVPTPPPLFDRLAQSFFPGPLTVLLPKLDTVPNIVSANLPQIGLRMPAHPIARRLIEATGVPLVAPSANLSGKPSSTLAAHVRDDFGDLIDAVIDGGACQYGIESTVITLSPSPQILRPGAICQQSLEEVLGCPVPYAEGHVDQPLSPGMKYRHYAPLAKVLVFQSQETFVTYLREAPACQRMVLDSLKPEELYVNLRQADAEGCKEVVIFCDEMMRNNPALMNRISRASQ